MLTKTTAGVTIDVRVGDYVKLRGISTPMIVKKIDAFGITEMKRVFNGQEESGNVFRNHLGDIAIESLMGS